MSIKDFLLWQRRSTKADSQTTSPPSNPGLRMGETHGFSRRGFIHAAAGATALAFGPGLSLRALAHDDGDNHNRTLPAPKPIPGGLDLGTAFGLAPPYDFIHVFPPGPETIKLPFTGGTLQGLDVETSTLTDFHGATALAYHVGEEGGATDTRTIWRPTCGSWRASTSPSTGARGTAASPSYESTCLSPVRARRYTTIPAAFFCRDSSGRSSFPMGPSA
jgi:hypothetical protein